MNKPRKIGGKRSTKSNTKSKSKRKRKSNNTRRAVAPIARRKPRGMLAEMKAGARGVIRRVEVAADKVVAEMVGTFGSKK